MCPVLCRATNWETGNVFGTGGSISSSFSSRGSRNVNLSKCLQMAPSRLAAMLSSVVLSVRLFVCFSACLSVCLSVCLIMFVCLFFGLSVFCPISEFARLTPIVRNCSWQKVSCWPGLSICFAAKCAHAGGANSPGILNVSVFKAVTSALKRNQQHLKNAEIILRSQLLMT